MMGASIITLKAQEVEITDVTFQYRDNPATITGMTQDPNGYIWMSDLSQGLFKYDGENLIHYENEPGNNNSLITNRLECVLADDNATIWIGTFQNGLDRFDPATETFTHYQHNEDDPESIRSDAIRTLAVDEKGMLWIGTLHGVDMLNPSTGVFTHRHTDNPKEEVLSKEHVRAMYIDSSGIIWIGSSSPFAGESSTGGLFKLNPYERSLEHYVNSADPTSLVDNRVGAIFEDSRGTFWVGTAGDGLHTMDRKNGIFERHPFDPQNPEKLSRPPIQNPSSLAVDHIAFINEDNDGHIWIGTYQGGLSRYSPSTKTTVNYSTDSPGELRIPINSFWSSLKTKDQLLWFSTWAPEGAKNVLFQVDANKNSNKIKHVQGMGTSLCFAEDEAGSLYVGGDNGLFRMGDNGEIVNIYQPTNTSVAGLGVNKIVVAKRGGLWLATGQGIYHYSPASNKITAFGRDESQNQDPLSVISLIDLGNDRLLIAHRTGLALFDIPKKSYSSIEYIIDDSLVIDLVITSLFYDSKGAIWISAIGYGVLKYDLIEDQFKRYPFNIGSYNAFEFFEDEHQNLYSVSNLGLRLYDWRSDEFIVQLDSNGFLTEFSTVYGITSGEENLLWLNLEGEILMFDTKSKSSKLYGSNWGISAGFINRSIYTTSTGKILVSAANGHLQIDPKDLIAPNVGPPRIFIDQMYLNDELVMSDERSVLEQPIEKTESILLSHNQNDISFKVNFIDFLTTSSQKRMQYQLEGRDKRWRNINSGELATFYDISPGEYLLRIKAMDANGNWGEKKLGIQVLPPWWLTWWAYASYAILFIIGVLVVDRFQRRRLLKQAHAEAAAKELLQAKEIEKAYNQLKETQSQLIHSEKMASLGELTAGIAHEIQNPLNFVNNFSEINKEMLAELRDAVASNDQEEVEAILKDLEDNEDKVTHHGKRAEQIVKSMLQHSRTGSGEKELTDINALCDEYLRLSYHGYRAKDKSFQSDFKLELDPALPKVSVVPQDIGRVLLNLINNAFQAVQDVEKPVVTVITKLDNHQIIISVKDNGPGIPDDIKDKIFQPFFTTKPTGEGTGLGLSMSYDIVTKGHGGQMKVETELGKGSKFIIMLPALISEQ